jgi:hypothetical protein
MASVESGDELAEYAPHKILWRADILALVFLDDLAEVSIAAVFHVQMKVAGVLQVVSLKVLDDIGVLELLENGQFSLKLLLFLLGHVPVGDFLATEDLRELVLVGVFRVSSYQAI